MLVTPEGQVDGSRYVDSHARAVVTVDHRAGAATAVDAEADTSAFFDAGVEAQRVSVLTALRSYVAAGYNAMGVGSAPSAKGAEAFSKAGALTLITSATVKNLPNYWSGGWKARYAVDLTSSPGKAVLSGTIRITTHYFENGNTQMHNDKVVPATTVPYADAASLGRAVVGAIAAAEDALVEALDEMYESMSSSALKEMRRVLPVSGVKMNWNVAEHRMRKTLATGQGGGATAAGAGGSGSGAPGHARGASSGSVGSPGGVRLPGMGGGVALPGLGSPPKQ
jgi:hypothetical protein